MGRVLGGHSRGGREARVVQPYSRGGGDGRNDDVAQANRVYVGNLSWDVRWQGLKDYFRQAGEVLHAEVLMNGDRSKGKE